MRLSLMFWDKNVRGREALSSCQEKILAYGSWVGDVAQQTRGASLSKIPKLKGPCGWVGCRAALGSSSPTGLGLHTWSPLQKPFVHVPSQCIGNQSKKNRFVFITPALKWCM